MPTQWIVGDPVDTADGDFSETLTMVDVKGLGPPLAFTASYDAQEAQDEVELGTGPGALGWGWSYPAGMALSIASTGKTVTVDQEDGSEVTFQASTTWPEGGCTTDSVNTQCFVPTLASVTATLELNRPTGNYTFARGNGGTSFTFSSTGQLLSVKDRHGEETTLTHGVTVGKPNCPSGTDVHSCALETDPSGRILRYGFNTAGQLVTLTDPDGDTWLFTYDGHGNLNSITSPRKEVTSFGYDTTDPKTSLVHDLISLTRPNGQSGGPDAGDHESVVYNTTATVKTAPTGWVTSATDQAGLTTSYVYTMPTGPAGSGTTTVTDAQGNKTLYDYVNASVTSVTAGYGTATPSTTSYARTARTLLPTAVTDPDGRTTIMRWNTTGDLVDETNPVGDVTTSTYNAFGEPLTTTDPTGVKTVDTYDADGDLTKTTVDANSSCTSHCTRVTTYKVCQSFTCTTSGHTYAIGEVESSTDPRGYATTYTYGAFGYPSTQTEPDGVTTATAYDDDGRLYCSVSGDQYANGVRCPTTPSTRVADTSSWTFDGTGDVLTATDPRANATKYTYDPDGNVTTVTDALSNVTTTTYDADDRPTAVTSGAGTPTASTTTTTYDIPLTRCPSSPTGATYCQQTAVGASTNTTTSYYDAQDRLTESAPPGNSTTTASTPQVAATTYVYDPASQLTSMTDAAGTTDYGYNTAGWLTQVSYAATSSGYTKPSTVCYGYNQDGLPTSMMEAACDSTGSKTKYTYNGFDRLVRVVDTNNKTVTYGYDATNDLVCLSYPGATTTDNCQHAGSGTDVVTYAYDHADRMTTMTDWASKTTTFGYDTTTNLTSTTFPTTTAAKVTYHYNADDDVTSTSLTDAAVDPTSPYVTNLSSLTYDAADLVTTSALTSGSPISYSYNHRLDLTTGQTTLGTSEAYSYDVRGDRTSITPTGSSKVEGAYDTNQELCASKAGSVPSCTAPTSGTTLFGYNGEGERCFSASATTPTASCASPPTGSSVTTYTWDQAGNLLCVTTPNSAGKSCASPGNDHTTTYKYNGDGVRMTEKPNTGTVEDFAWATLGTTPFLLADGSNDYLYGPSSAPVEVISKSGGARQYLVSDTEGVRMVLGSTGASKGASKYASYGTAASTTGVPVGFQGGYADGDGLIYLVHRYYDPTTAQFLSVDPAVSITGQPYSYANDDPVNEDDPLGLGCGIFAVVCNTATQAWNDTGGQVVSLAGGVIQHGRLPDYVNLNFGGVAPLLGPFGVGGGIDITITRNGHLYYGPEADAGIDGFSGSVQAGWIDQGSTPSACQIDQFVHGWSLTGNGYVPVVGVPGLAGIGPAGGETWGNEGGTSANDFATNVGIGFGAGRQLGVNQSYSFRAPFNLPGW